MKNIARIVVSFLVAALFLWLALREVSLEEVRLTLNAMSFSWVLPYTFFALLSNYIRAERWKQLLDQDGVKAKRVTIFSAVMLGYLVNYAVPRLGEISRSVYAGNKENISRSKVMGTVITERILDMAVMFFLFVFVVLFFLRDPSMLGSVLGDETIGFIQGLWSLDALLLLLVLLASAFLGMWLLRHLFRLVEHIAPSLTVFKRFAVDTSRKFLSGILSIKEIKNWPMFLVFTVAIWLCYILMAYIPFTAFGMHETYQLGLKEATIITVVSAIGVAVPSPGGMGTYHWFVSRSLFVFFAVPEAMGIAYAIVSHFAMMMIVLLFTPLILVVNKYYK
ncbi:lysylphosphatidylglycerol synthase transmembrane domain-containing protein [Balneolaceae bacterium ANBcel3]|nr:lysylphosphatidylglycerol synthase transmembrane domain-containing protein [Balneolaceae bacterium ANBcel3]